MSYYRVTYSNNYLSHHGVKGMKWGVWNEETKARYNGGKGRDKTIQKNEKSLKKNRLIGSELADEVRAKNTESINRAKKLAPKLIAAGALAAAVGGYTLVKSMDPNIAELGLEACGAGLMSMYVGGILYGAAKSSEKARTHIQELADKSEFKSLSDIPKAKKDYKKDYFEGDEDPIELMHGVNPGYPKPGRTSNCMMCTSAMVMRLKGYDVKAGESNTGYEEVSVEDWFEGAELKRLGSSKDYAVENLRKQGNGSYGNLMVTWNSGGGHSILYTVRNDKVEFVDAQCSKTYTADELFSHVSIPDSYYCQLDNCEPKEVARGLIERNK